MLIPETQGAPQRVRSRAALPPPSSTEEGSHTGSLPRPAELSNLWAPGKASEWHFLCFCSLHSRLRVPTLQSCLPNLKTKGNPGFLGLCHPKSRGVSTRGKTAGRKLHIYFPLVPELSGGQGLHPILSPAMEPQATAFLSLNLY